MEQPILRRHFPSFYRIARSCDRGVGRIRRRFSWAWAKLVIGLGVCLVWICLWAESHSWHRYAGEEFALGARGAGILVQATSYPGTLHLLMMRDRSAQSATVSLKRLTYLGNGGYQQGYSFELLGFAFSLLPHGIDGGHYWVSPYVALAVPYWFLTPATALLILMCAGWLPRPGRRSDKDCRRKADAFSRLRTQHTTAERNASPIVETFQERAMRLPRVRMTLRGMMGAVAIVAALLIAARFVLGYLGPRDGFYRGSYGYLGSDWRWHEVRGAIIYVKGGMIFVD